jgi:hypothetical protein
VEPGDTGLTLRLPEPVRQLEPPDGTTGVTHDTEFRVTELVGRVVQVRYVPVFPSDGPALLLTTGGSTWTVPDLSLYGIVLPPASEYAWSVTGHGSAAVDDLCDPSPFSSRPARYETHASWREFTTGP